MQGKEATRPPKHPGPANFRFLILDFRLNPKSAIQNPNWRQDCRAGREFLCCPATVGATKAATKPLLQRFWIFGSSNLDSNPKSKIENPKF
jgi:hypothetical protein